MWPGLLVVGWTSAAVSGAVAVVTWRAHSATRESVARASHELRGPITAARLGLHRVTGPGSTGAKRLRGVELELDRAALALDDLAGAVGLGSSPFAPRVRLGPVRATRTTWERVDVQQLLLQSVAGWEGFAEAHGSHLGLEEVDGPVLVHGDRLRLAQAIGNLVANAIEHGGGRVSVRCRQLGERARLEITDEGPGLPASVVQLTQDARGGRSRRGGGGEEGSGRGRGLAIAAGVARQHGGRLAAAPSRWGACLVLELPLARSGADAGLVDVPPG